MASEREMTCGNIDGKSTRCVWWCHDDDENEYCDLDPYVSPEKHRCDPCHCPDARFEALKKQLGEAGVRRVKHEVIDHDLEAEVAKVYDHITGGRISKPNTCAADVIQVADEVTMQLIEEARNG